MDICSECNYFDDEYGCLNADPVVDCPLNYEHYPNYLNEIENNIRAFEKSREKSISKKSK